MKILIVEDEDIAASRLMNMLAEIRPDIRVLSCLDSIKATVKWLKENAKPDLLLMDIHLSDGSSLEVFNKMQVDVPVIFTTAYDQYAIQAFKVNSIDYLLKPVKKQDLEQALEKFSKQKPVVSIEELSGLLSSIKNQKEFQKRIIVRYGQNIKAVEIADIAYFYTDQKVNFLCTHSNDQIPVDHKLEELEELLDPSVFYRINRQFIININAIDKMYSYTKARVKITLSPPSPIETIVSTERSPDFKEWLLGK